MPELGTAVRRLSRLPLIRGSLSIMTTTAVTSLLGFLFWTSAAQSAPASEVGTATAALALAHTSALVTGQGLQTAIMLALPAARPEHRGGMALAGAGAAALLALLGCLVAVSLALRFSLLGAFADPRIVVAVLIASAAQAVAGVVDASWIAVRRPLGMPLRNAAFALGKLTAVFLLLKAIPSSGDAALVIISAWGVANLLTSLAALLILHPGRHAFSALPAQWRALTGGRGGLRALGHHHLTAVAGQLPAVVFPLLVAAMLGPAQAAYFNIAWMVGGICFLVSPAIASALLADGGHEPGRLAERTRLAAAVTGALLAVPVLVFAIFPAPVLALFGPGYAVNGSPMLILLALSAFPDAITNLALSVYRLQGRLRRTTLLSGGMSVAAVLLLVAFLPPLGIAAGGVAWLTAQTLGCVSVSLDLRSAHVSVSESTPKEARLR